MATSTYGPWPGRSSASGSCPADLFGAPVNVPLMHQVVIAERAPPAGPAPTRRRPAATSRGGGSKPWRQKGTGRARQGSIRAPQWTGGGVAHGPIPRDHSVRVNKKMRAASLRSALTDAAQSGKLAVVEDLTFDAPRTKDAIALLAALELEGHVLMVLPEPHRETELSFRNLGNVQIDYPGNLGTYELLYADSVVFTMSALDRLTGETSEPVAPSKPAREAGRDGPHEARADAERGRRRTRRRRSDAPADDAPEGRGGDE